MEYTGEERELLLEELLEDAVCAKSLLSGVNTLETDVGETEAMGINEYEDDSDEEDEEYEKENCFSTYFSENEHWLYENADVKVG